MKMLIVLIMVFSFSGCASLTGAANYKYSHVSKDGSTCTLVIDSGRVFKAGVDAEIDTDCKVTVKANSVEAGQNSLKDVIELAKTLTAASGQ